MRLPVNSVIHIFRHGVHRCLYPIWLIWSYSFVHHGSFSWIPISTNHSIISRLMVVVAPVVTASLNVAHCRSYNSIHAMMKFLFLLNSHFGKFSKLKFQIKFPRLLLYACIHCYHLWTTHLCSIYYNHAITMFHCIMDLLVFHKSEDSPAYSHSASSLFCNEQQQQQFVFASSRLACLVRKSRPFPPQRERRRVHAAGWGGCYETVQPHVSGWSYQLPGQSRTATRQPIRAVKGCQNSPWGEELFG